MVGISENERVLYTLLDVKGGKRMWGGGIKSSKDYDVFFTENGIAFVNNIGSKKRGFIMGFTAAFGAIGALAGQAALNKSKEKARNELQGLTLKEILERNKDSFYLPYNDVRSLKVRTERGSRSRMLIQRDDAMYAYVFPKKQMEVLNTAISDKLATKKVEWDQKY
jgi:hypothetical protein